MITVTLQRKKRQNKAVRGMMTIPFDEENTLFIPTLENADYLIPAGIYPLSKTYSPKFRKLLPLIEDVPNREGIRIHGGTQPEHSTGCILVDPLDMYNINLFIDKAQYRDFEEVQIQIIDEHETNKWRVQRLDESALWSDYEDPHPGLLSHRETQKVNVVCVVCVACVAYENYENYENNIF